MKMINKIGMEDNVCQEMADGEVFDMEQCLAGYYARQINCSSLWEKDLESFKYSRCNTSTQYKGMNGRYILCNSFSEFNSLTKA